MQETDFLFDKSYECPVCDSKFKARTLRTGKARLLRTDMDLRTVYEGIEPLKYEPVICPTCGYSALSRNFNAITASQRKAIKENISKSFHAHIGIKETYTFDEAAYGYKMCLASAIVKSAKASEIAYICLKMGWLYRSKAEALAEEANAEESLVESCHFHEKEYLQKAYEGFLKARENESFPICGMDEMTVEYLLGVLAMKAGDYELSSRMIGNILTSHSANQRIKDKAREVKEELHDKIHQNDK